MHMLRMCCALLMPLPTVQKINCSYVKLTLLCVQCSQCFYQLHVHVWLCVYLSVCKTDFVVCTVLSVFLPITCGCGCTCQYVKLTLLCEQCSVFLPITLCVCAFFFSLSVWEPQHSVYVRVFINIYLKEILGIIGCHSVINITVPDYILMCWYMLISCPHASKSTFVVQKFPSVLLTSEENDKWFAGFNLKVRLLAGHLGIKVLQFQILVPTATCNFFASRWSAKFSV